MKTLEKKVLSKKEEKILPRMRGLATGQITITKNEKNDWFEKRKPSEFDVYPSSPGKICTGAEIDSEIRFAKYWAAEEMAKEIIDSLPFDDIKYIKFGRESYSLYNGLSQLLKKEWFR